jgi:hypothetical protein
MQSAAAHIHLAEHHDHDGSRHQHQSETHVHQSIDTHADAIDFSHQVDHANVVELDHECSTSKNKPLEKLCATSVASTLWQPAIYETINIELPVSTNTKLSHLYRSTIHLRAPPQHY